MSKQNLRTYLLEECFAMVKHLSSTGKEIPLAAGKILDCDKSDCDKIDMDEKEVLVLHKVLAKQIAPARPNTIWLLFNESQKSKWLNFLGPVDLVRRMMLTALLSLLVFILVSLSPLIDYDNIREGIFELSGLELLIILIFYLASASLGASFSNLFMANQYIINNTYDSKFESSYWIRFVLGIIAGIMLAVMIPMPNVGAENDALNQQVALMSRPMLAMLGGFSAALVYRIMFRLVYAVESLFAGKPGDQTDQKVTELKATHEQEKETLKQTFVNQLLSVQGQLNDKKTSEEISQQIKDIIGKISPESV